MKPLPLALTLALAFLGHGVFAVEAAEEGLAPIDALEATKIAPVPIEGLEFPAAVEGLAETEGVAPVESAAAEGDAAAEGEAAAGGEGFLQAIIGSLAPTAELTAPVLVDWETRVEEAEEARDAGEPAAVLQALNQPDFLQLDLSEAAQLRVGQLRAGAYEGVENYLGAARELVQLTRLLPVDTRLPHHDHILRLLLQLDGDWLQAQAERSPTRDLRGWLALAAIIKQHQESPVQQLSAFSDWLRVWSSHPAAIYRPPSLQALRETAQNLPQHLALVLPLSGDLASIGTAIRDGFITAHYRQSPEVRLSFHDSSSGEIRDLLRAAWDQGAQLIIGPLARDKVARVARMSLKTPVIALNRARDGADNPNLYQFGLAPEDESIQVAERIIADGGRRGLLIAPDSDWGERSASAFTEALEELGGELVDSTRFAQERDDSVLVKALLKVDASEARQETLSQQLGRELEFVPRRRQDIDFVALLANADQAKSINPTLAFYFAENLPRYASSHVHELSDSRIDLIDMNGLSFCDMPFKLPGLQTALKAAVRGLWPGAAGRLAPFYALGLDAHRIYPQLQQLRSLGISIEGVTGRLSLGEGNVVRRSLSWARIHDGEVERLRGG